MSKASDLWTYEEGAEHLSRHKSIIAYLTSTKLSSSAGALRQELNIGDSFDDATSKKYEGLLEKKWTSVVRLQKKVGVPSNDLNIQRVTDESA